ncbi:TPA: isoleucine--tRNA ligase, partial [Patescibacteria group bacterium]|nr:isoleucine--tRNA ligase [Patescibacteria group bacterium]HCR42687.1 isoleucine--tRNA ligase [Patescibacteria group bacterium]
AVMYGEDDYQLGEKVGLPKFHTVLPDGKFGPGVTEWAGQFVKDHKVEQGIIADLDKRGLLFKEVPFTHDYPFCWRCETPLIYYASDSWFIAMSKLRDQLIKNNATVEWTPTHIKDGRFGEWLREVKDWGISRERYWGTPLPFWVNSEGETLCVGSFSELHKLAKEPEKIGTGFDPHKPFVDNIVLVKGGKEYTRVPEVLDVWFDSGAMPFAQWHYPNENAEKIDRGEAFPADFISEAIDQTRGWFYTLLAVSTLLGKPAPYKHVVCLGHILDKHGKKMSKSKGNVVDPWMIFDKYGSDALRWYFITLNQPGLPKNFDEEGVKTVVRRLMLTLWNTYSFFVTYANIDGFTPDLQTKVKPKEMLDKWIWTRRDQLIEHVTYHLDRYEPMAACLAIESFVEDLSNWYVRRSRRRFWKAGDASQTKDKQLAYGVLYGVLKDLTKLMAPFMPFLAEAVYANLKTDTEPISVHLTTWPRAGKVDEPTLEAMSQVRHWVEVGLNQREAAGIKVRQPLARFSVKTEQLDEDLVSILRDELNVKEIVLGDKVEQLDTQLTDALREEGLARELVRAIQVLRKESGFEIQNHIKILWQTDNKIVQQAIQAWGEYIRLETLADAMEMSDNNGIEIKIDGDMIKLLVTKVS